MFVPRNCGEARFADGNRDEPAGGAKGHLRSKLFETEPVRATDAGAVRRSVTRRQRQRRGVFGGRFDGSFVSAPAAALGSDGVVPQRQRRPERSTVRGPGGSAGGGSGTSRAVRAFATGRCGDQGAFANVPVPAGLADRVSRRLAEAAPTAIAGNLERASPITSARRDATAPSLTPLRAAVERYSRRRLLVGFTALSTAAAMLAAVWIQTHPSRHDTADSVLDEAMDFFGKDNQPFGKLVSGVCSAGRVYCEPRYRAVARDSLAEGREVSGRSSRGLRFAHDRRSGHALYSRRGMCPACRQFHRQNPV